LTHIALDKIALPEPLTKQNNSVKIVLSQTKEFKMSSFEIAVLTFVVGLGLALFGLAYVAYKNKL
jgi:hypothetical protein